MKHGFLKVAAATPKIKVANCEYNAEKILELIDEAYNKGASLIVFPELCITSYTCGDLFLNELLLNQAKRSLINIADKTREKEIVIIVGLPIKSDSNLYNCAAVLYKGEILGIVPKSNIPNYSLYSELRYFKNTSDYHIVNICDKQIPLSGNLIFCCNNFPDFTFGVEICEDVWSPFSPSNYLAVNGANLIANLSASDEYIGKSQIRRDLIKFQSLKTTSNYIYSSAGPGESTTDNVFSGHNIIAENGKILVESDLYTTGLLITEVDLSAVASKRTISNVFSGRKDCQKIYFNLTPKEVELTRTFSKNPFLSDDLDRSNYLCKEAFLIQQNGLKTRLKNSGIKKAVLGISGGVDSTLALITVAKTFDSLGLSRENIICVSMPGFGTSSGTYNNSKALCKSLGVSFKEVSIKSAAIQHFKDIGKLDEDLDTVYENAQARERTQILMDLANKEKALVIGTGDLSEIALGFMTYNGDHMSMYAINCGIPKTMAQQMIIYYALNENKSIKEVLIDIINTPISPELLPSHNENCTQKTEDIIGPYELHDFFIYYFLLAKFSPEKILRIAKYTFKDKYSEKEIKKWLKLFLKRFFSSQFKRSCSPDGPKVTEVSLSPRVSLSLPSDMDSTLWLQDID